MMNYFLGPLIVLLCMVVVLLLVGCGLTPAPPTVTAVIDCPPPPPEAVQRAAPLPIIPVPAPDAQDAVRAYARALAETDGLYIVLAGRHASLVRWGVEHCEW